MSRPIPIRNIFFLYCYAWNQARLGPSLLVGREDPQNFANLLAHVLIQATRWLLRSGLEKGYSEIEQVVSGVRGHISFGPSLPLIAQRTPRLMCRFTEQDHNTPANRVLKAALARLAATEGLDRELATDLKDLARQMYDVPVVPLNAEVFRGVQIHRNTARYDLAMHLCRLASDLALPVEGGVGCRFADPLENDDHMSRLFEAFVRNFWRVEATIFRVASGEVEIKWDAPTETLAHPHLPAMRADIVLEGVGRRIIVDTKFYRDALVGRFAATKVRSERLYQLLAYLRNDAANHDGMAAEGILLYPAVANHLDDDFTLEGHSVRVATVDLDQPWAAIAGRLLSLLAHTSGEELTKIESYPLRSHHSQLR
ncbi:MAG: hypothetical protein EXQ95_04860 [Alphaproteobacteria bacterium]|nr:hypothetical protein [Alphaproteobacteria bacterium]